MPASLIAFLQNNKNCLRANLFSIFLPTGQVLNVTDGQWDITVGSDFSWLAQAAANAPWWQTADTFLLNEYALSGIQGFQYFSPYDVWINPSQLLWMHNGADGEFLGAPRTTSADYTWTSNASCHYDAIGAACTLRTGMSTGVSFSDSGGEQCIGFTVQKNSGSAWGTWQCTMSDGSTVTTIDSGVTVGDTPGAGLAGGVRTALSYSVTGGVVTWFINGNQVATASSDVPTASLSLATYVAGTSGTGTFYYQTEGLTYSIGGSIPGWGQQQTTFYATKYGKWSRGTITSEASFGLSANTMALTLTPQPGTVYPGLSIGMLNAANNGLFDAAQVYCYTVYMPIGKYGTVYQQSVDVYTGDGTGAPTRQALGGVETKFFGAITRTQSLTRVSVEFECADPFFLLNLKVPTRLLQTSCPYSFADGNCNPPGGAASFTQLFTADVTSTQWVLNPTATTGNLGVANYYTQGVVKCLTGNNAGLSQTIAAHGTTSPIFQMMNKWILPIQAGDTFSIIAGCDKSLATCALKFNNASHHAGMPFIPVPTAAI